MYKSEGWCFFYFQCGLVVKMRRTVLWGGRQWGGVRAAVVQHTLQSLNTAGLYNDGPSPTVCACAHVHSSVTDVRTVVSVFLERQSSAACDLTLSRTVFFFFFF